MISTQTAVRLLGVKQNQLKMVRDRGYNIEPEEPILDCDPENPDHIAYFIQTYQPKDKTPFREGLSAEYQNELKDVLAVFYPSADPGTTKLGVNPIARITDRANKIQKLRGLIIISDTDLSTTSAKLLAGIKAGKVADKPGDMVQTKTYPVQFFFDDQLIYNPTEHYLVPKHIALTPEEQKDYYERSHTRPNQMAILRYVDIASRLVEKDQKYKIDPIVAWYGWRPGQVVKIERVNFITETLVERSVTFRRVSY